MFARHDKKWVAHVVEQLQGYVIVRYNLLFPGCDGFLGLKA